MQDKKFIRFLNDNEKEIQIDYYKYLTNESISTESLTEFVMMKNIKLIRATTGSGKTYTINKIIQRLTDELNMSDKQIIFTFPTVVLTQQAYEKYEGDDAQLLVGSSGASPFYSVYFCTYDKLINTYDLNKELYLFVDESHQLIASSNYRKTVNDIVDIIKNVAYSTTMITATANIFEDFGEVEIAKRVNYIDKCKDINIENLNIYRCKGSKRNKLINILIRNIELNKKTVVFLNEKKEIENLKNVLNKNLANVKIEVLHSGNKQNDSKEVFDNIVKNSSIGDIDILLSTKIIEEGIDIKDINIESIYYVTNVNHSTIDNIIQSLRRVRTAQKNSYIIMNDYTKPYIKLLEDEQKIDIKNYIDDYISDTKLLVEGSKNTLSVDEVRSIATKRGLTEIVTINEDYTVTVNELVTHSTIYSMLNLNLFLNIVSMKIKLHKVLEEELKARNINDTVIEDEEEHSINKSMRKLNKELKEKKKIQLDIQLSELAHKNSDKGMYRSIRYYFTQNERLKEYYDKDIEELMENIKQLDKELYDTFKQISMLDKSIFKIFIQIFNESNTEKAMYILYNIISKKSEIASSYLCSSKGRYSRVRLVLDDRIQKTLREEDILNVYNNVHNKKLNTLTDKQRTNILELIKSIYNISNNRISSHKIS